MSIHQLELTYIIKKIKELKAFIVGLQFPEGLKVHAIKVARQIELKTNATVIISADPCYGACDVADVDMRGLVDVIVHFGHRPLPIDYDVPVIFVDASSNIDVHGCIENAMNFLEEYNKIGLVTTTQHLHILDEVADLLEHNGKKILINKGIGTTRGQVLGCNFSAIKNMDADAFLYVGSGNFHALGIKLFTHKPVFVADPYLGEAREIDKFADRILRIRYARIAKAMEAERFGIIVSSKKGQSRLELAKNLKNMLNEEGKEGFILFLDDISPKLLLPFMDLDAFIMTACPRIAIDDSNIYKKPLLTPKELEILFKRRKWENYEIDEIKYTI
ncbi:MAG: diphthamide biosynthesis enzyme Dph2 [Methanobacterium sp.]|nr:diphthamide biosynthesis enzyme Dph2 [Methanobacterium sp.]